MSNNLITLIIPTFNREHIITRALDSVIKQSYRPIEIIIVDDGSTDDTNKIVTKWWSLIGSPDGIDLNYLVQENKGPSAARNLGINKARGEYVQFLDSDDLLHFDKLTRHIEAFTNCPSADVTVSRVSYTNKTNKPFYVTSVMNDNDVVDVPTFMLIHHIPTHAPVYRRKSLLKINGFNELLLFGEEVDMHFRLAIGGAVFYFLSDILAFVPFHVDPKRVSRRLNAARADFESTFYSNLLAICNENKYNNAIFHKVLNDKLLSTAKDNLSSWRLKRAKKCLEFLQDKYPHRLSAYDKLLFLRGGIIIGAAIEWSLTLLKRVKNKTVSVVKSLKQRL